MSNNDICEYHYSLKSYGHPVNNNSSDKWVPSPKYIDVEWYQHNWHLPPIYGTKNNGKELVILEKEKNLKIKMHHKFPTVNIETINIPENVISIEDNGLGSDLVNLKSIYISKNVLEIGDEIFRFASKLKKVIFDEESKLEKIGNYVFGNCPLKSIQLPESLKEVGYKFLKGCSLKYIVCSKKIKDRLNDIKGDMDIEIVTYDEHNSSITKRKERKTKKKNKRDDKYRSKMTKKAKKRINPIKNNLLKEAKKRKNTMENLIKQKKDKIEKSKLPPGFYPPGFEPKSYNNRNININPDEKGKFKIKSRKSSKSRKSRKSSNLNNNPFKKELLQKVKEKNQRITDFGPMITIYNNNDKSINTSVVKKGYNVRDLSHNKTGNLIVKRRKSSSKSKKSTRNSRTSTKNKRETKTKRTWGEFFRGKK